MNPRPFFPPYNVKFRRGTPKSLLSMEWECQASESSFISWDFWKVSQKFSSLFLIPLDYSSSVLLASNSSATIVIVFRLAVSVGSRHLFLYYPSPLSAGPGFVAQFQPFVPVGKMLI